MYDRILKQLGYKENLTEWKTILFYGNMPQRQDLSLDDCNVKLCRFSGDKSRMDYAGKIIKTKY